MEELFPDELGLDRTALEGRIDRLAELAWQFGHPLDAIQRNVERFYAMVGALEG
ncbi:MAG: hypothetical protein H6738_02020 [Alphaproteobacteria bacterium]|nr:hypothetical protein [Alphaproteobacteria bacterium]MCB9695545.1 hypothetical protein [Alphaproteobacteria bacterium]